MMKLLTPDNAPKPVAPTYSTLAEIGPGTTTYHISGQVGVDASGKVLAGSEAQLDQIWRNILGVLQSQEMGVANIAKVTVFLTRPEDVPISRKARERALGDHKPASTLLIVAGLAGPDYLAEIEVIAAK